MSTAASALPIPSSRTPAANVPNTLSIVNPNLQKHYNDTKYDADVLILGAGPAALSCALGLSRQLYTTLIFSTPARLPRNNVAEHMHIVVGHDHKDPKVFREEARRELCGRYATNAFVEAELVGLRKLEGGSECGGDGGGEGEQLGVGVGFEVKSADCRTWTGKKVVIATGVRDVMLDIEGYAECWGHGIFHCLFCHGYEERGHPAAGVLAVGDLASVHSAPLIACQALRLARTVTVFTNGDENLATELKDAAQEIPTLATSSTAVGHADGGIGGDNAKSGFNTRFHVDARPIARFSFPSTPPTKPGDTRIRVYFSDGDSTDLGFLAHKPKTVPSVPWHDHLHGLEVTEKGDIKVNAPFNETSVKGVFAAGDVETVTKAVVTSLASGMCCAAGCAMQLGMGR